MRSFLLLILIISLSYLEAAAQIEFVSPPGDTSVCAGDTAVFEVIATPVPDSLLWQYASFANGPWLPLTDSVEGETTSRLKVLNSGFYDGKYFRAIAFEMG